ncbi:TPA: hypothetical protein TXL57_002089 [Streptococcus suis]|nr:hypothetical protein [Streptococcus suis]
MVTLKSINWLDESSYEGEVTLVDSSQNELVCFSYSVSPEDMVLDAILANVNSDIFRSEVKTYCLTHIKNFEYHIVGNLLDSKNCTVKCFDFVFKLDGYLPGDLEDGEWIEFGVGRFDL